MNDMISAWRACLAPDGVIRVVLADVDGCLTAGEGQPLDLDALAACAEINRRARSDPLTPAITLCTGRPAPYVEVLLQAIAGFLPALAEHGGLLLSPLDYHLERHPLLAGANETLEAVRAAILRQLVWPGLGFVQPGKETMLTFYPAQNVTFDAALTAARGAIAPFDDLFAAEFNRTCIEVRRRRVDKGSATEWLAGLLDLPLTAFAGIGDSDADLAFLSLVGWPTAPANAIDAVRASAAYVASLPNARGVLEIVAQVEARNRALAVEA
jgi:hydroxymethylpyrimidine pyrophosphatase-like HAD family hydrolase